MSQSEPRSTDQLVALQERLASLEAQGVRYRRTQLVLVAALVAAVIVAAARPAPDVITARQFALLDANGNECGVWGSAPPSGTQFGSAYLTFRKSNESSGIAVSLEAGEGNPSLLLMGSASPRSGNRAESSASLRVDDVEGGLLKLQAKQTVPDAPGISFRGLETSIGLPWAEGTPFCLAKSGAKQVWAEP